MLPGPLSRGRAHVEILESRSRLSTLVALSEPRKLPTSGWPPCTRASGIPYGQPARVHDWCFREQTLGEAITTLLRYHQTLPLTASFGPGTTSSSDGMRFGSSASVLGARHLPRYFGVRRGLSVYSHVSDQGPQFALAVINCQLREATFALDGVLHQDVYRIEEHYTDTHGYTDLIFGLCEVLGVRFAPRPRDLPDQVIYRAKRGVDYGSLAPVLRRGIRDELVIEHWDKINRVAASLHDGLVAPSLVVASCSPSAGRTRSSRRCRSSAACPRPATSFPMWTTPFSAAGCWWASTSRSGCTPWPGPSASAGREGSPIVTQRPSSAGPRP